MKSDFLEHTSLTMFVLNIIVFCLSSVYASASTIGGVTYSTTACSKFDFEEKVLEKLVRLELKIEIFEQKQKAWEEKILVQLTKFENTEQSVTRDITIAIDNLNRELDRQKSILSSTLDKTEKATDAYIRSQMVKIDNTELNISRNVETLINTVEKDIQNQVKILQGAAKNVTNEVIALSHNLEIQYDNQIKAIYETINSSFRQMDVFEISRNKKLQSFTESTQNLLDDFRENMDRANENLKDMNNTIKSFRQDQNKKAPDEDKRHTIPAFGASTGIHKNLAEYEIVKFEKVWTNIENCYDHYTGVFTAPRTGVYQFSCTAMTDHNRALRLYLYKNELQTVSLYPGSSGYNMGTLSMVLELTRGDKVYIKHANGPEVSLYSEKGSHFTMFSGYMISL